MNACLPPFKSVGSDSKIKKTKVRTLCDSHGQLTPTIFVSVKVYIGLLQFCWFLDLIRIAYREQKRGHGHRCERVLKF